MVTWEKRALTTSSLQKRVAVKLLSHVWLFATLWTAAHKAPLFMGFSRQEYWTGLPFPSSRGSSWPKSWTLPAFAGRFFTTGATWEVLIAPCYYIYPYEPQNINTDPDNWWDWKVPQGSTTNHWYMLGFEPRFQSQNYLPLCWTPFPCAKLYPTVNIMFLMTWSASRSWQCFRLN